MLIDHTTQTEIDGATHCAICKKPFLYYWKDRAGTAGHSDTTTKIDGKVVHFSCAGGKSLQQLNEERKLLHLQKA